MSTKPTLQGAHWEVSGENLVHVSIKPNPGYGPIAWVHPDKFKDYHINGSPELGCRVAKMLAAGGIDAVQDQHVSQQTMSTLLSLL